MKKRKINDPLPAEGLLKSEAIGKLKREGYDVSFEQLRKYEPGLVVPDKKPGSKYRIYTPETLEKIRWICRLRMIGFSLPKIKSFFKLRNDIIGSNLLSNQEVGRDPDTGERIFIKEMPPASAVGEIEYERLRVKIHEFNSVCTEVKEKAGKAAEIMTYTREETAKQQAEIKRMTDVHD